MEISRQSIGQGHRTIISVYPGLMYARMTHAGITDYRLKPAERGSYSGLVVYDTYQWISQPNQTDGKPMWMQAPIPAQIVAEALVKQWARSLLGNKSGHRPGIDIVSGDDPTPSELDHLRNTQTSLFRWYIQDANGKHLRGEHTEINELHRTGAFNLLESGAEKLPWYPKLTFTEVKPCLACGKNIESRALVCPECRTNLVEWYVNWGLDPSGDSAVKSFLEKVDMAKAQKQIASLKNKEKV